jgi:uncharacterized coiled-coil protein SlyX
LIVDPNAPSEETTSNVARVAEILSSEPPSAAQPPADPNAADVLVNLLAASGTGEPPSTEPGEDTQPGNEEQGSEQSSQPSQSAIEQEIKLLSSLVEHGKAIAKALPEKEQRLKELEAQLDAAKGAEASKGAEAKLAEQELLLSEIRLKIDALKKKLEDLQTTETKLVASIDKVKKAVDTNAEVTHELNQAAAKASVGDSTEGAGSTASTEAPAAGVQPATSFVDDSVNAASDQARALLKRSKTSSDGEV